MVGFGGVSDPVGCLGGIVSWVCVNAVGGRFLLSRGHHRGAEKVKVFSFGDPTRFQVDQQGNFVAGGVPSLVVAHG
jgi:hypothetical protein